MRIVSLRAENFKRLKAVEIQLDQGSGGLVIVAGRNAQGKSSVLDAIWAALGGRAVKIDRPVRDGEEEAHVWLDLGDIQVHRRWVGSKSSLTVQSAAGAKFNSPQAMLDQLIGRLSFDPMAFAQQDPKKQLEQLLAVIDLPFDLAGMTHDRKAAFDRRTEVNREVKRLEARLSGMPKPEPTTPDEEVKVSELVEWVQQEQARLDQRARLLRELAGVDTEIANLQARRAVIIEEGQAIPAVDEVRLEHAKSQLGNADNVNAAVRAKKQRYEVQTELDAARNVAKSYSDRIEYLDKVKADAVESAKMPVPGLSFNEEGVLYHGVPFTQASAAERMRVSVAMAMALNPNVRVICIRDASLLDSENMLVLEQMASELDYQIWVERVDETGTVGITIEDGSVAE